MTYFDYQYFHQAAILAMVFFLVMNLSKRGSLLFKILYGLSTLLVLLSGVALFPSANISSSPPYPLWVWGKFLAWTSLAFVVPILIKRTPNFVGKISFVFLIIILAAAYLGIYKIQ